MLITLITDASWCSQTQVAGWAAWAVTNGIRRKQYGPLRAPVPSSGSAELRAVANGLAMVVREFTPPYGAVVIIQTDCEEVLSLVQGRSHTQNLSMNASALHYVDATIANYKLKPVWRHVKGHVSKHAQKPRHFVNSWCDEWAKKAMRAERESLKHVAQD